jgi:hypothetical protein
VTDVTLGPNGSSEALQRRLEQLSPAQRALFESKLSQAGASPAADVDHIPRRADGAAAPLTAGQEVLWTLQRALPDVFAYNVPRLLDVRGHLDIDALHSALDAIVARHEILRTRFVETSEGPRQVVDPPGSLFLERLDLRGVETRGATVTRLIEERIRLPFNLESDPPLRATVVRVEDEHWRLLLVSHHIASDEASRDILFRELGLLYQAALAGTLEAAVASLPPLPVRFGDFAAWQKTEIERGGLAEQIGYWRGRLLGLGPLELPTDRPRTWAPGFDGARHRLTLPDPVRSGVAGLARRSGASQFMVLLAAVNALLHRYTGQTDIAVGSPVAGRRHPDL